MPPSQLDHSANSSDVAHLAVPEGSAVAAASTLSDRLAAEGSLLASLPGQTLNGLEASARKAWNDKPSLVLDLSVAAVLGAGLSLLSRNPNPVIACATTWGERLFIGVTGANLAGDVGTPMYDVWKNTNNLAAAKRKLGANLGDAVFNMGVAVAGGAGGALVADNYLAATRVGQLLSGVKTMNLSIDELRLPSKPTPPLGKPHTTINNTASDAALKEELTQRLGNGKLTVQILGDKSQLISGAGDTVAFIPRTGPVLWFEKQGALEARSFFPKVRLTSIRQENEAPFSVAGSRFEPHIAGGANHNYWHPLTGSLDNAAEGHAVTSLADGSRLLTHMDGSVAGLETDSGRAFIDRSGNWHYQLAGENNLTEREYNLTRLFRPLTDVEKGAEFGLGRYATERVADIGIALLQHSVAPTNQNEPTQNKSTEAHHA